jgi:hypothetical protein
MKKLKNLGHDGTTYLNYGGAYMTSHVCQNSQNHSLKKLLNVNYTFYKFTNLIKQSTLPTHISVILVFTIYNPHLVVLNGSKEQRPISFCCICLFTNHECETPHWLHEVSVNIPYNAV